MGSTKDALIFLGGILEVPMGGLAHVWQLFPQFNATKASDAQNNSGVEKGVSECRLKSTIFIEKERNEEYKGIAVKGRGVIWV